ncbi:hypothetical protein GF380_00455 [Candidatus Uhrbacteria bacterium]|nr:hypothetical protein [Candidatus Uhrbacteria bacterium]MBD3284670.1 hypothetical protein [Candidatus Uhrbacteria bacterium]
MPRLYRKQKQQILKDAAFWVSHALHWYGVLIFLFATLGIIYLFFGNDAAFAAAVMGEN